MDTLGVAAVLHAERAEVLAQITSLARDFAGIVAASESDNADDEHDPEGATIAFERSQVGALLEGARRHLEAVDEALARWAAGEYGRCQRCGHAVAPDRLAARPAAATCIGCA